MEIKTKLGLVRNGEVSFWKIVSLPSAFVNQEDGKEYVLIRKKEGIASESLQTQADVMAGFGHRTKMIISSDSSAIGLYVDIVEK